MTKEYPKRFAVCISGLALYGLGNALGVLAGAAIDVYDMAVWMSLTALSAQSIELGGMPQPIPDFTCGKWAERDPISLHS